MHQPSAIRVLNKWAVPLRILTKPANPATIALDLPF